MVVDEETPVGHSVDSSWDLRWLTLVGEVALVLLKEIVMQSP
jgi:hypothetical protein